jgi:PAS domain S-box-containing protein
VTFDPAAFLATAPLVPVELAADGAVRYVGEQGEILLGVARAEWLKHDFWTSHIVPDDQRMVVDARAAVVREGVPRTIDYRIEHADGRVVWVCESIGRGVDSDGSVCLRGYLMEVTDRKRQEVALWKSEERLRALLRSAPDAMVLTDFDGRILEMNDQAEALLEYRLSDVVGSSIDHLTPARLRSRIPELRAAFDRDPHRRSLIDGHGFAIERSDGTEMPVELSMSIVTGADDSRQLLCSLRDLTTRRRVEAQLRSSEQRLREMANVVPAMVCSVDTEHRYRFVNDAYARWHGWERHQMEGRLFREVVGEKLFTEMSTSIDAVLAGDATHFRGDMADVGGRTIPVDVSLVPQHGEEGDVTGYFVVVFDVTSEIAARDADRRHRDELAHVGRVATMGELAASIAHELNQPLSAIVANAQAAQRLLGAIPPDLEEVGEALADISAAGSRAGNVIASIRDLLQRGETRDEAVDLVSLTREVIDFLHSEVVSRGVAVAIDGSDAIVPTVRGDRIQLKQLLLNLLMNAIEAAARSPAKSGRVDVVVAERGQEVEVAVTDTGPGLPTDDIEDLFTPFVSRRADGLGMGLAICRSIVEAHDGQLWGENNPGGGAAFRVRLPLR